MTALNNYVLVQEIKEESSGLIEYSVNKPYIKARVLSVGNKVVEVPIKKDDIVYFTKDCIKLMMDDTEKIWGIDIKYIVAKD